MSEWHISWAKGGSARLVEATVDTLVVRSTIPSPPGSRIEGELLSEPKAIFKMKVHGSRKQSDGTFILEGRPIDLTRELRERLETLVSGAAEGA